MNTYFCSKCGHRHKWDSEVGSKHATHGTTLFTLECSGIVLMDVLGSHIYNPESIEYIHNIWIVEYGNRLKHYGEVIRRWLTWDGHDVEDYPTTKLGYPILEVAQKT